MGLVLNEVCRELLIDYLLESETGEYLNEKYAGFESIVIMLVNKGNIKFARDEEREIEEYFNSLDFVEYDNKYLGDSVIGYKLAFDTLQKNVDFEVYRTKAIRRIRREINSVKRELSELEADLNGLNLMFCIKMETY